MSLLLYLTVLLVSVSSVLFGLDWLAAPAPQYKPPALVAANHASEPALPPLRHLGSDAAARLTAQPVAPPAIAKAPAAAPAPPKTVAQAQPVIAPPPDAKVNAPPSAPAVAAAEPEAAPADIAAAEPAPEPAPKCDVRACEAAYISFRAEDCTYQPSFGQRRLCEKGTPPAAPAADRAQASAAPSWCHVQACQQAYFTFTAADCTYKPSNGPRRVCTK
jgi:BA14K-like protein